MTHWPSTHRRPGATARRARSGAVLVAVLAAVAVSLVPGVASADDAALAVGTSVGLESVNYPGQWVRSSNNQAVISSVSASSAQADRADASFVVRAGLADAAGISLESISTPGWYLRSPGNGGQLVLARPDGSTDFAGNATFRPVAGLAGQGTSFQMWNAPGLYLGQYDFRVYPQSIDGSSVAKANATFQVRMALAPATRRSVTPLAECATTNSDGSATVVLGYTNPNSTSVTIAAGSSNAFSTTAYNSSLPTTFSPGTQHGVASVTVARADVNSTLTWTLEGATVNVISGVPACAASPLPMVANGAAVVGVSVLTGLFGAVVFWRQRRPSDRKVAHRG